MFQNGVKEANNEKTYPKAVPKRSERRKLCKNEMSGVQVFILSRSMGYNPNKLCLVAFACDLAKDNTVRIPTSTKLHPILETATLRIPQKLETHAAAAMSYRER